MIDLEKIYGLIAQAFSRTQEDFHWGDNAVVHGTTADLPIPSKIAEEFTDGDYFAVVLIQRFAPEDRGNRELFDPGYEYQIDLMRKGKGNVDVTKTRNDMITKFGNAWLRFWTEVRGYQLKNTLCELSIPEIEGDLPVIGVRLTGVISKITATGRSEIRG